jgi:hypothetical protein
MIPSGLHIRRPARPVFLSLYLFLFVSNMSKIAF